VIRGRIGGGEDWGVNGGNDVLVKDMLSDKEVLRILQMVQLKMPTPHQVSLRSSNTDE
jgi:hypothetical protein